MKKKALRTRTTTIHLFPEEYASLREQFKSTTHRVFADYLRDLLHRKPVTIRYRNQSFDEFLPIALALSKELRSIGKTVNQAVKKLDSFTQTAELKDAIDFFAAEEFSLQQKTNEIKNVLIKMYELCSVRSKPQKI